MPDMTNRSVTRAFHIINELANNGSGGVSDLSDRVDLPVSTVHNYLQALVEAGYVIRENQEYHTSTRFLDVGHRERQRTKIYSAVSDELETLADETGEQVTLVVEEGGQAVLLAVREGNQAVDLVAYPGARMPLYANAGGKAILAHMSYERRTEFLENQKFSQITKHTITDVNVLRDQIETIRERGYAIDEGERIVGLVCTAVPVLDRMDTVQGAICVCGPKSRTPVSRHEEIAAVIKQAANITQVNLDYV